MTKEWHYVLSAEQREFIRRDSIEVETRIAANCRTLIDLYLKMELFDLAQQMAYYAEHYENEVRALEQEVIE